MRRLFVIFLALLFPLNVFALSMSVSAMQASGMPQYIHAPAPVEAPSFSSILHSVDSPVSEALCDIDPDEPPTGMDFHDTVHAAAQLPFAAPPDASVPSFVPSRRGRDPLPPIKPPPSA